MGVGPEDTPSDRSNEAALHSKPRQASTWPSKPSSPDKDDEDETKKDHGSDSDDDIPEFPGFVLCFAPRRRSSFYLSNLQRCSQRQDCRASNRRAIRETYKTRSHCTTQVTFSTRLHLGKYQWIYCYLDHLIDIFSCLEVNQRTV